MRLFISLLIPYVFFLIPRTPHIWLYGGRGGAFVDNTKYWFLWANKNEPGIKHIWISSNSETITLLRDNGFFAYKPFSILGFYYVLRAKIVFFTHGATSIIRPVFLKSAIKFDFFHGIPLKSMGKKATEVFSAQFGPNFTFGLSRKLYQYYKKTYVYSDHLVIPSELFVSMFTDFSGERLFVGYPRNQVFQIDQASLLEIIGFSKKDELFYGEISAFSCRYIYMPTFREGKPDFIQEAFNDLSILNQVMVDQNAIFLLKLHPYTQTQVDFSLYSNLKLVDNQVDIYPFLPTIDFLITDYSSISLDFYFSKKPILFYVFDLDEFVKTSRVLDYNPMELAPQTTALNWDSFIELLRTSDHLPTIDHQQGKDLFRSHLPPDLPQLSRLIKNELLMIAQD